MHKGRAGAVQGSPCSTVEHSHRDSTARGNAKGEEGLGKVSCHGQDMKSRLINKGRECRQKEKGKEHGL